LWQHRPLNLGFSGGDSKMNVKAIGIALKDLSCESHVIEFVIAMSPRTPVETGVLGLGITG
jgi:hypothetical protein